MAANWSKIQDHLYGPPVQRMSTIAKPSATQLAKQLYREIRRSHMFLVWADLATGRALIGAALGLAYMIGRRRGHAQP